MEYAPNIRRFLNGTPNVPAMYSARSGYEIVNEIGVERIRQKSSQQTQLLISLAQCASLNVRSPLDPAQRGGVVIIDVPSGKEVTAELIRRPILVDYRPGAGARIAPHFYTSDNEVRQTFGELAAIVKGFL
jgi:kynureninase